MMKRKKLNLFLGFPEIIFFPSEFLHKPTNQTVLSDPFLDLQEVWQDGEY